MNTEHANNLKEMLEDDYYTNEMTYEELAIEYRKTFPNRKDPLTLMGKLDMVARAEGVSIDELVDDIVKDSNVKNYVSQEVGVHVPDLLFGELAFPTLNKTYD